VSQFANIQNMVNATDKGLDVQSMINKALIGILISKEIVTEEEILIILGNINRQQEIYFEQQKSPS
jgi:predicted transcriptional regulator